MEYSFIRQDTLKVLEEFGELEGKWDKVPLGPNPKVIERLIEESKTPDYEFMKQVQYRELIGAGSWLAKGTRPDILFAISFLSRFQTCFTEAHWKQAKQVFAYLRGTLGWGILYSKNGEGPFKTKSGEIVGFADANWGENDISRRSTTGIAFGTAGGAIAYSSRRQKNIALSSTEAEIYALTDAAKEATFLKGIMDEIHGWDKPIRVWEDNISAIDIAMTAEYNKGCTKHLDVRQLYIKEANAEGIVDLDWISSEDNVADILTKPLGPSIFNKHRRNMGIVRGVDVKKDT